MMAQAQPKPNHSPAINSHNNTSADVLCKIAFDLDDGKQELLVHSNTTLTQLAQELIKKLKIAGLIEMEEAEVMTEEEKNILKVEIKVKIEEIMDLNVEKSLQAAKWRSKLKDIAEERIRTPMDSLLSPSTQRLATDGKTKSVSYFRYNQAQSSQESSRRRQTEIIQRMRNLQRQMGKEQKGKESRKERLYDLGRQTEILKEYLSKAHEYEILQDQLSECTFHPNIRKINAQYADQNDVFSRLYNEAVDKQSKMRLIEEEVAARQQQEYKHLNFIPKINQCSKEIIMAKKLDKTSIYESLHKEKELKGKKFQPEYTFHPTICQKSQQIAKKISSNKLKNIHSYQPPSKMMKNNISKQQSTTSLYRATFKTEHSPSPLSKKQKSTSRLSKYKINRNSDVSLKQIDVSLREMNDQDTLKKVKYDRSDQGERTLKQNIFGKKAFKKDKKKQNNSFVESKNIKREKVMILDTTDYTCNTQQSLPLAQPHGCYGQPNHPREKGKKPAIDPLTFFQLQQRKGNNKQNMQELKQEKGVQLQFHKRKNKIFEQIFVFLLTSSRKSDEITYEAILNNSSIPETLRHIFYPMAEEMKQLNVGLDQEEFIWSMIRIFDSLPLQQRGWVLAWGLKLEQPAETTKKFR